MRRRYLIRTGAVVATAAIAGCNALRGESEAAEDALDGAAEDLLAAEDELGSQYDSIDTLEGDASFDREAVDADVDSAREQLDTAEAEARLEETVEEIDSMRSVADYIGAAAASGEALALAHDDVQDGFDRYGEDEFEGAVSRFEDATEAIDTAAAELDDAEAAVEAVDVEALTRLDVDREGLRESIDVARKDHTEYRYSLDGLIPLANGDARFAEADAQDDAEEYGRAASTYGESRRFYDGVSGAVEGYEDAAMDEDARSYVEGLVLLGDGLAALAGSLEEFTRAQARIETAFTYVDSNRYDDAVGSIESADESVSSARDRLGAAGGSLDDLATSDAELFGPIEVENRRDDVDEADAALATMDELVTGLIDYVRGIEAFEDGVDAGDREDFGVAAQKTSEAAVRFEDAESRFGAAEQLAPPDMRDSLVDLVCLAGALAEGSALFSEGYTALDNGDTATANQKFEEGQAALEQCDSDGSPAATAGPVVPQLTR